MMLCFMYVMFVFNVLIINIIYVSVSIGDGQFRRYKFEIPTRKSMLRVEIDKVNARQPMRV